MRRKELIFLCVISLLSLSLFCGDSISDRDDRVPPPPSSLRTSQRLPARKWAKRHQHQTLAWVKFSLDLSGADQKNLKTFYFNQTLDHFNYRPESYTTFKHRYLLSDAHWCGGRDGCPIFVYLGGESDFNDWVYSSRVNNFAAEFRGLLVFIDHRYYGDSIPFGSKKFAYQNSSTLGYLSTSQALADYAEIILHIKKRLSAEKCPVIVFGCSYAGQLAAYFRLKYPHITIGAVGSSAPVFDNDGIIETDPYDIVVSRDFKGVSESCYDTIKKSWSEMDKIASEKGGLARLSKEFKCCSELQDGGSLKDFLAGTYYDAAQYGDSWNRQMRSICSAIDGKPPDTDVVQKVAAGLIASHPYDSCFDMNPPQTTAEDLSEDRPWTWQTCTELVPPLGPPPNDTIFTTNASNEGVTTVFQVDSDNGDDAEVVAGGYYALCKELFGVTPRRRRILTEYGGMELLDVLKTFGSNIIFSNSLRDPYSYGGVLKSISGSVVALTTAQGSHCMDLSPAQDDDPEWLVSMRREEMRLVRKWIDAYRKEDDATIRGGAGGDDRSHMLLITMLLVVPFLGFVI